MTSTSEDEVAKLARELQAGENIESEVVLERIKASVSWTPALAKSAAGEALFAAIRSAPLSTARTEAKDAYHTQVRDAEVKETMERWWSYPPVPADGEVLELTFVDVTPGDECWGPEKIPCTADEPFAHAAQRFRVAANKKHRHPFLPTLDYTLVLDEVTTGSKSATFDSLAARTVADVLGEQNGEHTIRYLRGDDRSIQSPARFFEPWDRARILPSWWTTPDTWIEPAPPPGFSASKLPGAQFYIAVPTIYMPGAGVVHSAIKPQFIARTLYWPVHNKFGDSVSNYPLQQEEDYVPPSQRLVPSELTPEAARALLGRYIQSSSEPSQHLRDDGPPSNKKRKAAPINKYASQTVAIAWGLTLDDDGRPDWLHCVMPAGQWQSDCVIDLKGLGRWFDRARMPVMNCAWIGAVVLDADRRALHAAGKLDLDLEPKRGFEGEPFEEWEKKTQRLIKRLNTAGIDKLVEVGEDGTFVAGDVEMSKADHDEWEACISGAKPGVWRMSVAPSGAVCFAWVREGKVDYDALPQFTGSGSGEVGEDEDGRWEELGSFSVDSGVRGLFSQSALDALLGEGQKQEKIETFVDAMSLEELGEYMPCGVVVSGDDGGYVVEGIRDAAGKVVKLRVQDG